MVLVSWSSQYSSWRGISRQKWVKNHVKPDASTWWDLYSAFKSQTDRTTQLSEHTQRESNRVAYSMCDKSHPVPTVQASPLNLWGAATLSPKEQPEKNKTQLSSEIRLLLCPLLIKLQTSCHIYPKHRGIKKKKTKARLKQTSLHPCSSRNNNGETDVIGAKLPSVNASIAIDCVGAPRLNT